MRALRDGFGASEGIGLGVAQLLHWEVPEVPHRSVPEDAVEAEVAHFEEARSWARNGLEELRASTERRLGIVEARIFEPQLLMLEDEMVVEGTLRYIRENRLSAARALDWRMLELRKMWGETAHPMVLDRLNDLEDLQVRLLRRLLALPEVDPTGVGPGPEIIIVAEDLSPSLTMRMNPERVVGIVTEQGTRTSHWAILARSLGIPAVVGVVDLLPVVSEGQGLIVDGRSGRVLIDPSEEDRLRYERRRTELQTWERDVEASADVPAITADGREVSLLANLDLPQEATEARRHGARGVGLFRTEFLVVGRSRMPDEEEQYLAYRKVLEAFAGLPVLLRTFDLGGDKFPLFLRMPSEENPFLGWRAIRVCLDRPDLFRPQLRAILRASAHGRMRVMLPFVNTVQEVERVQALLLEERENLAAEGKETGPHEIGVLIETPGAALLAHSLAEVVDFLSIGTNDLTQYALAVDRSSSRLSDRFTPFHPGVLRLIDFVARAARERDVPLSVCGELAAHPLGAFFLLGVGLTSLSVAWPSLSEMKRLIRRMDAGRARAAAAVALAARDSQSAIRALMDGMGADADVDVFSARWSLSQGDPAG